MTATESQASHLQTFLPRSVLLRRSSPSTSSATWLSVFSTCFCRSLNEATDDWDDADAGELGRRRCWYSDAACLRVGSGAGWKGTGVGDVDRSDCSRECRESVYEG